MTQSIIKPTIGRKVWYRPNGTSFIQPDGTFKSPVSCGTQPMDATVIFVWSDRMVNLDVIDHMGNHFVATSVTLVQPGDPTPSGSHCEWMPYQQGQAAKTEATEKASQ